MGFFYFIIKSQFPGLFGIFDYMNCDFVMRLKLSSQMIFSTVSTVFSLTLGCSIITDTKPS